MFNSYETNSESAASSYNIIDHNFDMKNHIPFLVIISFIAVYMFLSIHSVSIGFDEGWLLSLVRNWVEFGHYGHFNGGNAVPATILNTGFPAVALYALCFKLAGIGVWQASWLGTLLVLASLVVLYALTCQLYNRRIAILAVLLSVITPVGAQLNPLIIGRQALGEMPAILYLLLGYLSLLYTTRRYWLLIIPSLFFTLAIQTKPQVMPFILVSLLTPLVVAIYYKRQKAVRQLLLLVLMPLLINQGFSSLWQDYLQKHTLAATASSDPYSMARDIDNLLIYVVVFNWRIRIGTLIVVLFSMGGLVSIVGVVWYGLQFGKSWISNECHTNTDMVRMMLWTLTASWLGWFLFLSIGWLRYAFPGVFLGNIFAAYLVESHFSHIKENRRMCNGITGVENGMSQREKVKVAVLTLLLVVASIMTIKRLYASFIRTQNDITVVTQYLNENVADDELIETYESELFFLLDKPYHHPPDDVQHLVNRRLYLDQDVTIEYDPLLLDPEYIVVGVVNSWWHLYDEAIASEAYQLVYAIENYQIYQKFR